MIKVVNFFRAKEKNHLIFGLNTEHGNLKSSWKVSKLRK